MSSLEDLADDVAGDRPAPFDEEDAPVLCVVTVAVIAAAVAVEDAWTALVGSELCGATEWPQPLTTDAHAASARVATTAGRRGLTWMPP